MRDWRRGFITIWFGQAISVLTSSVSRMALVWYITQKTSSAALLSLGTLIGFLPQALLGMFIGVYIDRYKRKTVMILSDLLIASAGMILVVAAGLGDIPIPLIYAVLFLCSIGSAFHSPALNSLTPMMVPREELTRYAGFTQGFKSLSMVISPALAALLYSVWSLNFILLLDVIGALLAVAILLRVKLPKSDKNRAPLCRKRLLKEAKEGFAALKRQPGLLELLVISCLYAFIYFPIGTLYPLISMSWFGGSVAQSGTVEAVFSFGMLCGSFLLGLSGGRLKQVNAILLSIGVYGAGTLITGLLPPGGLPVFIGLSLIMGMTSPFFHGVQTAVYQSRIEDEYMGRVLSLTSSISLIAMPLGLILSGAFAEVIGVNRWFAVSGALTLLLFIAASRILPKKLR